MDATLLFADVSGFTKLGERLAKKGRIGAEELSETVNTVFAGMLDEVSDRGGEILKFGGDAVLASFTGEEHQLRGAAAGLGMQEMLRRLRRQSGFNLRLSAGVASGTANLFLGGGTPRELIVAGPLTTEVCALEALAEAGEVLASTATARHVPSSLWRGRKGPGVLLKGAAPTTIQVHPPQLPEGFNPRPALPLHLHEHIPGEAEHRPVTVGFLQFRGTDALLQDHGPAALAHAIDDIVGAAADAALAHGITFVGTDVDKDAGKIILAAGAPTAGNDDDDRMLHALRTIIATPRPLTVRAGVNRGRVFSVDIGNERRRTWTVMGDAVNLAARVMGRAEPGTVLATQSVLMRLRDEFAREPIPPFTVKGKTAPVFAEQVGEALGTSRARAPQDAPLVGRDVELDVLRDALAGAARGDYRTVEIVGEPGMGKSRLIEAISDDISRLPVVVIRGGPYSAHSPYRAVQAPLRRLIGCEPADAPDRVEHLLRARAAEIDHRLEEWLPLVGIPFGLDLPPTARTASLALEFARSHLNAWCGRLVDGLLPEGPSVLLVEDAHWLDDASSDLLLSFIRNRRPGGFLIVTTRAPVEQGLQLEGVAGNLRMALAPLTPEALREMVAPGDEDETLPPGVEDQLIERAAGNPLLLQELLAAARTGESIEALPDTVEALVTARIDTLPRADRRLLREASVLGSQVSVELVAGLLERDPFDVRSTLARLDGFLVPSGPGVVRFRHTLLRDAAYEGLPFRRRRELHSRAADLILRTAGEQAEEHAELLTIHTAAAHRWPDTWRFAVVAGRQALARAAPVEAAAFFDKALEAGRAIRVDPLELARIGERQGSALRLAGRFDDAAAALESARRRAAGHALTEATLCLQIGRVRERSKNLTQALRWITRGLSILESQSDDAEVQSLRARMWLTRALVRVHQGRLLESTRHAGRAAELARDSGNRWVLGCAYTLLHWAYTLLGSPERERYRGLALPIFEELGDLEWQGKALNNLGVDAYWSGRWDEAVDCYERGREALEQIGDVVEAAVLLNNIAEIRSDQGRLDEAEDQLRRALSVLRAANFGLGVGLIYSNLGRVAVRRGDVDAATRHFDRARAILTELGANAMVLELDTREAERLIAAGEYEAALELAGRLRETAHECQAPPALMALTQRVAALAKFGMGDVEGALVRLHESVEVARSVSAVYEEALSLEMIGRLGGEGGENAAHLLAGLGVVTAPAPA